MISMNDFCINAVFVGISVFIVIFLGAVIAYPIYWFVNTQIDLRKHLDNPKGFFSIGGVYVTGWPEGWTVSTSEDRVCFDRTPVTFTDLHVHKAEEKQ